MINAKLERTETFLRNYIVTLTETDDSFFLFLVTNSSQKDNSIIYGMNAFQAKFSSKSKLISSI